MTNTVAVIPAQAGVQFLTRDSAEKTYVAAEAARRLDPRLRGDDDVGNGADGDDEGREGLGQ